MEPKPWYPDDFKFVLSNTLTEEHVDKILIKRGCSSRFVYGMLMLPTILKHFIAASKDSNLQKNMTQATLYGYKLYQVTKSNTPVIAPSSDPLASVDGVLIFGLDSQQRNSIYRLEGRSTRLVNVQVEISCRKDNDNVRSLRRIEAGTFAWTGDKQDLLLTGASFWKVDDLLKSPFYQNTEESKINKSKAKTPPPTENVLAIGTSFELPIRRPESHLNALRRRFESRSGNILDDIEWPDK
ncbi:hypothetical protein MPDQ_002148 [Monascus purpureus]|uniref:Putative gamma-glutamylcyclotransferase n=1 Tax=Monascus purpureus TaxID=5098 RepID=A0A507QQ69_MONPU|nr:hypothetical protein MPDQ_002148 [Monascus purpureus]BDD62211.1 hypothetical protein MAP00_007192 [Monascus purpureus]